MTEIRSSPDFAFQHSVRADDKVKGKVEIDVCPYNVVDSYQTRWMPGVFNESIEKRSPPMCFGHSWLDPIGHMVDHDDNPKRLHALYQLDNFDDVPRARQVYSQIRSGTLTDTSFGFERVSGGEDEPDDDGVVNFRKSNLQEVSPVLIGAVPGARPTGTRQVSAGEVLGLARQLEGGEISLDEALTAITRAAVDGEMRSMHSHARQNGGGIVNHSHTGQDAMHAHSGLMPAVTMGRADGGKHTHAMAGGGSFTHSHDDASSGHSHAEDAKGNSSGAQLLPMRSDYDPEVRAEAKYSMPNGTYPIDNCEQAHSAAVLAHNSKTYSFAEIKAHVMTAMKGLSCPMSTLPDTWSQTSAEGEARADGPAKETAASDGPIVCVRCQASNNGDASYCDQCGKALGVKSMSEGDARSALAEIGARE